MLRENKPGIFANLILVMLMSLSICQTLYTSLFMTDKLSLTIFITVAPLTLLFFIMFKSKITTIVSAIVISILLIIGLSYILFKTGIENTINWIYGYTNWLIDIGNGYIDSPHLIYTTITIITLTFIITLFIFIFSIKIYNFYVICIMLFSVFFVQLQFNIFLSKISFILFVFSFLLYYFFDILRRRSKEKNYVVSSSLKYLIYIVPICILVMAISFLFPVKDNRIALSWLDTRIDNTIKNVTDNVTEKINEIFYGKDLADFDFFSINLTGFGSDDRLGGNIKLDKTQVMNVKSEYSNLYLKASSRIYYDGHGWSNYNNPLISLGNNLNEYSDEINSDSNEFLAGSLKFTKNKANDAIFKPAKAEIEYTNLKTKSLFMPPKPKLLTFKSPQTLFQDDEQILSTSEIQKKGFSYTIEYNSIMFSSDEFKNSIRKSYKGFYTSDNDNIKSYSINKAKLSSKSETELPEAGVKDGAVIVIDSFSINSELFYRNYTQLPAGITPRVRQLAEELTKDEDNSYDKAKAIETYLSNNYPYTLSPGNPPRRKDFVDYFLFEGKEGYCTYYASAMTVLLRCIDIPARYVEGYMLPPESENGVFKVTNQQAHAWVEVYFEGFGWIPFEPTSPFGVNMYNDKVITESAGSDAINSGYDDYMDMINKYRTNNEGIDIDIGDIDTTPDTKSNKLLLALIILSSIIGVLLLAFCILALINMFRHYRTLRKIRKGEPNIAVLLSYNYILKVLRLQNISLEPGETPSQFGTRVEKTFDFMSYSFNKTSFTKITSHYVNARYSKVALLKDDKQNMLDFINLLLQFTNEKLGKFKYAMARYVLGKL